MPQTWTMQYWSLTIAPSRKRRFLEMSVPLLHTSRATLSCVSASGRQRLRHRG